MTSHRYTSRGKIIPSIQLVNGSCNAISVLDTLYVSKVQAEFSTIDSTLYVCYGNKLDLLNNSIGSDSWKWSIDNVPTSTNFNLGNILFNKTGDYKIRLIAMASHGCSDTLTKTYSVVNKPVFSISGDSVLCSGENSVGLSVNKETGWTIKWTPSSGLSSNSSFTTTASPSKTTTYTALVTNSYGCTTRHEKTILVNQPYDLSRKPAGDTTIYIGEKIQLIIATAESNINYSWSPAIDISCTHCNNPWVSPIETTTYTVETKNNCFDFSEEFLVNVIRDFYLEAPSAFTPNGDSNNDIFRFEGSNIANFDLKIFNRWGDIVFSTNDINQGWDGTVNGHSQNIDTYKYLVVAETTHGYKFEKKGEFLLLK
jgi:gliding motility-associated-like protein